MPLTTSRTPGTHQASTPARRFAARLGRLPFKVTTPCSTSMSISPRAPGNPARTSFGLTLLARLDGELLEGRLLVIGLAQMVQDAVIAHGRSGLHP